MKQIAGLLLVLIVGAVLVQDSAPVPLQRDATGEALSSLAREADLILLGTITAYQDASARDGPITYECAVREVISGKPPKAASVWFDSGGGGRLGGSGARYWIGERVLLFLEGFPPDETDSTAEWRYRVLPPFAYFSRRDGLEIHDEQSRIEEVRAELAR